jgi:hypothetical protein
MTETLTEMFDRMIKGTKEDTCPAPIGIETSVQARLFDARFEYRCEAATTFADECEGIATRQVC